MPISLLRKASPSIESTISPTLSAKNLLSFHLDSMNEPERHPMVLKRKYTLVALPAVSSGRPVLSMIIFGAHVLTPTSIPTWATMPKKSRSTVPSPRSLRHWMKPADFLSTAVSGTLVPQSRRVARMENAAKIGKTSFQSPKRTAAQLARIGVMKEAIALTNCPKVSVLASFSLEVISDTRGFRDTCIRVLPTPRRQKETSMTGKLYENSGSTRETEVTARLISTVFRFPIRFIIMLVGTDIIRNQKNTIVGRKFATVSDNAKSALA